MEEALIAAGPLEASVGRLKFPLERPKKVVNGQFPWASCAPFVENSRGTLIHRPRSGSTYNLHRNPHIGVSFWCGMGVSSDGKSLTFLAAPPEGRILCERCEAAAVANGLQSADELAGRHVHKGRTVAVATCCDLTPNVSNGGTLPEVQAALGHVSVVSSKRYSHIPGGWLIQLIKL